MQAENGIIDRIAPSIRDSAACGRARLPAGEHRAHHAPRALVGGGHRPGQQLGLDAHRVAVLVERQRRSEEAPMQAEIGRRAMAELHRCRLPVRFGMVRISLQNIAMPSSITCRSSIGDCLRQVIGDEHAAVAGGQVATLEPRVWIT